jgi:hypothetical protein
MRRSTVLLALVVGLLATLSMGGCSSGNSPEGVVRDYLAAVTAGDMEKALSYISPDSREGVNSLGTYLRYTEIRTHTKYRVREIFARDLAFGGKEVVATVTVTSDDIGTRDDRWYFQVEKVKGHWYIRSRY